MTGQTRLADRPKFILWTSLHAHMQMAGMMYQGFEGPKEQLIMHDLQIASSICTMQHSTKANPVSMCTPVLQDCMLLAAGGVICRNVCDPPLPPKYVARLSVDGQRRSKQLPCSHIQALAEPSQNKPQLSFSSLDIPGAS